MSYGQTNYQDVNLGDVQAGGGEFELPDPGVYVIEFLGVIDKKNWPKTNSKTGETIYDEDGNPVMETSLTLQFRIDPDDEDYPGVEFRDFYPLRVTAKNKSGALWAAFLGTTADNLPSPLPKTAEFEGKKAQATLTHRDGGNGRTYAKIAGIVPLRRKKRAAVVEADEDF